jgi:hypothetical protein
MSMPLVRPLSAMLDLLMITALTMMTRVTIQLSMLSCLQHMFALLSTHALAEMDIASTWAVTSVLSISQDPALTATIIEGYETDSWCKKLCDAAPGMPTIQEKDKLLFIGDRL